MSNASASPSPLPPGPAAPDPAAGTAYRPLSLLALAGTVVAGLYAAVVVVGAIVALIRGDPLLLPGWSAVFPVLAAALSLAGLVRVRRSEGTVGGGKLARWGLLLSVLVGLSYWAYYGAVLLPISGEADQIGHDFLTRLAGRDVLAAFRLVVPPGKRPPEGPALRAQLETYFNGVTYRVPRGNLTAFAEMDYVEVLGRCGPETKFESLGVEDWEFTHGGYFVRLLYRADAPELSFEMTVTLKGEADKASGGRRWQVVVERTGLAGPDLADTNAEWKRTAAVAGQSREFVEKDFVWPLQVGKGEEAFLCTLPPAERPRARASAERGRLGLFLAAGVGPGALPWAAPAPALALETLAADEYLATAACLPGLDEFLGGGLVRADRDVYWAPDDIRDEMAALARQAFRRGNEWLAAGFMPDSRVVVPRLRREGDRYVIEHDFAMRVPPKPARYLVEGRVVVEGDAAEADRGSMNAWRIRGIYLVSAKAFPEGSSAPGPAKPGSEAAGN